MNLKFRRYEFWLHLAQANALDDSMFEETTNRARRALQKLKQRNIVSVNRNFSGQQIRSRSCKCTKNDFIDLDRPVPDHIEIARNELQALIF